MFETDSLCDVAFRYARWLRETGQWDAMTLFTFVIHPAVGKLASLGQTRIADIDARLVRRTILVAIQDRIDPELAIGAWADFLAFLDAEGVAHQPLERVLSDER
ncbi:MAG TPA: hypothetical protein VFW96_26200 [Thermomicrobiales bacterium]|nr:hypothetical protein [Thermomicrobiales bacterium]